MRVKIKDPIPNFSPIQPGKIYDACESGGEYLINIHGWDWRISKAYCEIYKPSSVNEMEIKNLDGTYTFRKPTAYFTKKEIQQCDLNTNKIFLLQPGLKSQPITRNEVFFVNPLAYNSPVIFSLKVCENNPDWFEPIYDEEKPKITDVKKVNLVLHLKKIKTESQDLIDFIEKEL